MEIDFSDIFPKWLWEVIEGKFCVPVILQTGMIYIPALSFIFNKFPEEIKESLK